MLVPIISYLPMSCLCLRDSSVALFRFEVMNRVPVVHPPDAVHEVGVVFTR